ncbi:hypothetical protein APR41_02095 [Salegentibacter salinarum]|uniref:Guanylate cyclase domain-containing protein n=1 Tax=Salegentibacter salinarum TaxID=447422 RepID=A0A2N0U465_9FLAO|nr:adenylate/guanylate cyclase domain-containing protein [Salegentibacter salinarum]PKD21793.1 hypothetical protein APR41_02095 [Salegentibacter salinarum]SKB33529.1 adenylate cyclase [Salegentibacter salinarum]
MPKFEYTTLAQRYTARFPLLTYVGTQVNFWIMANVLLVIILNLQQRIIDQSLNTSIAVKFESILLIAIISGIFYGISLGLSGYYLDRSSFGKLPLGEIIVFKAGGSLILLTILLWLLQILLFNSSTASLFYIPGLIFNEGSWRYLIYLLLIYYFFMTLIISFINQVNRKYGPGVLVPLLLGRYRNPREEERIFMFMDLKSSTTTAERLGHLRYSAFIRDCYGDINEILFPFRAQVYQYVGDEIVVMWPASEGLKNHFCIRFYFACQDKFRDRRTYYTKTYGFIPEFKAGLHMGKVTAVEIGEIKKDIAYHGDTLNTAARIQGVCNEYNKDFIVSDCLIERVGENRRMTTEDLGMILLRGKTEKVRILSVGWCVS